MAYKKTYTKPPAVIRTPFTPSYPPSIYQQAIFDALDSSNDHIHISAVAGSGKSTSLVWAMALDHKKNPHRRAAMLAFNKAIVTDIEPRCPDNVQVKTCHSYGYASLAREFGKLFLSEGKVQKIFRETYPVLDPNNSNGKERGKSYAFMFDFLKLVDMLRINMADENNAEEVLSICMKYGLEFDKMELVLSILPVIFTKILEKGNVIDYIDMVWMPLRMGLEIPKFDMLYVDECQDLSPMMLQYVFAMTGGRAIFVGDIFQSIYNFGGADSKSIPKLIAAFPGRELPLSVSYRCAKNIVALAQTIVPHIMPYEGSPDGVMEYRDDLDMDMADGSMILCRRNAGLIRPCFAFLRKGRKAVVKGKDIGAGILKLVRAMSAANSFDLIDKIEVHRHDRLEKLMSEKNIRKSMVDQLNDECDMVREIALGCEDVGEIEKRIENIFSESTSGIMLSSIHRSKGLEANQVTIVDYSRVRLSSDNMTEDDAQAEINLNYVGVTRAKTILHLQP